MYNLNSAVPSNLTISDSITNKFDDVGRTGILQKTKSDVADPLPPFLTMAESDTARHIDERST